jgi:Arc/MetJ-type ribon-helix-helix transcriptional regulator
MRTTVEITDEQRARLLQIAASRGQKGFSGLVQEAIDLLLERESHRATQVQRALEALGSVRSAEADEMLAIAKESRSKWR